RLVVLAERFRCPRNFQPTMGSARARGEAERADPGEYRRAVAAYPVGEHVTGEHATGAYMTGGYAGPVRSGLVAEARRLVGI
ncbi:hypothetical protein, partial [Streptomyces sp. CBMA156]|uniref:hypothetical protein n=1 Tax=Streptomyces sp. CBMA156 TaxID=1930280 RepID=UPI001661DD38